MSRDKVQVSKVSVPFQSCTESDNLLLKKAAEEVCTFSSGVRVSEQFSELHFLLAAGHMEHPRDCHEIEEREFHHIDHIDHSVILFNMLSPAQDNGAEDPSDDWALPPSPAPGDCLPKRSSWTILSSECAIKPLGFSSIRPFNPSQHPHPHLHRKLPQHDPSVF
jgi:hypothetical protein